MLKIRAETIKVPGHRRLDRTFIHWDWNTEPRCHLILLAHWVGGRLSGDPRWYNLFNQLISFRRCLIKLGPFCCRLSFLCFMKMTPTFLSHLNKMGVAYCILITNSEVLFFQQQQSLLIKETQNKQYRKHRPQLLFLSNMYHYKYTHTSNYNWLTKNSFDHSNNRLTYC